MFRWLRIFLSWCMLLTFSACMQTAEEQAVENLLSTETPTSEELQRTRAGNELEIYLVLLRQKASTHAVVLKETTAIYDDSEYIPDRYLFEEMSTLSAATLENFKQNNRESYPLPSELETNANYVLISYSELDTLIDEHGVWDKFNQKYPNRYSYYDLSKVGFNPEMDQALLYMGYSCGGECGKGEIYFLEKIGDRWYVTTSCEVWVA